MSSPDSSSPPSRQFRDDLQQALRAVDDALESFPKEATQSLHGVEVPTARARDRLIEQRRNSEDEQTRTVLGEALERVNVCLSLVLGMEYPQGSRHQEPVEQARTLLVELLANERLAAALGGRIDESNEDGENRDAAAGVPRRRIIEALLGLGGLLTAAVTGIPALVAAVHPALEAPRDSQWRRVGRLSEFPLDEVRKAVAPLGPERWDRLIEELAVYVWRRSEEEAVVFSRNCTDLSCPVNYDPGSQCFFCPCHGGIFAKDGTPMAGPPPRPLHRYATRVRQGVLEIDLSSLPPMA